MFGWSQNTTGWVCAAARLAVLCFPAFAFDAAAWPAAGEGAGQSATHTPGWVLASGTTDATPFDFYRDNVDTGLQSNCLACHKAGGSAPQGGARLVLGESARDNHNAFVEFLDTPGVSQSYTLSKVTGGNSHGGGAVLAEGSTLYQAIEDYLALLQGDAGEGSSDSDF